MVPIIKLVKDTGGRCHVIQNSAVEQLLRKTMNVVGRRNICGGGSKSVALGVAQSRHDVLHRCPPSIRTASRLLQSTNSGVSMTQSSNQSFFPAATVFQEDLSLLSSATTRAEPIASGWLAAAAAATTTVAVWSAQSVLKTDCESESLPGESTKPATANASIDTMEEEDDDPYANLPEEDEETTCSMCQTFRQGPCRPQWRKLERCFKDHEDEENGAVAHCMRYFTPHQECLMRYSNLYQLVLLQSKQELVNEAEQSVQPHERRQWKPSVDWSELIRFYREETNPTQFRETVEHEPSTPLWQRYPPNTEPVLLTIKSDLPKQDSSGLLLKLAYAVDQDGMVLGMSYNKEYGALLRRASGTNADQVDQIENSKDTEAPSESNDDATQSSTFLLDFVILPGETQSVRVCALYAENPLRASPQKDILDALLFTSPATTIRSVVAKKKTKKAKKTKAKTMLNI